MQFGIHYKYMRWRSASPDFSR